MIKEGVLHIFILSLQLCCMTDQWALLSLILHYNMRSVQLEEVTQGQGSCIFWDFLLWQCCRDIQRNFSSRSLCYIRGRWLQVTPGGCRFSKPWWGRWTRNCKEWVWPLVQRQWTALCHTHHSAMLPVVGTSTPKAPSNRIAATPALISAGCRMVSATPFCWGVNSVLVQALPQSQAVPGQLSPALLPSGFWYLRDQLRGLGLFIWIYGMVFEIFTWLVLFFLCKAGWGVSFIHCKKEDDGIFAYSLSVLAEEKKAVQMPLPYCWVFIKGAVCDLDFLAYHGYSLVTHWFLITPRHFRPIFFWSSVQLCIFWGIIIWALVWALFRLFRSVNLEVSGLCVFHKGCAVVGRYKEFQRN